MSLVLADSSTWIEFLRDEASPGGTVLADLLARGLVSTHGLIQAEILSGAKSPRDYRRLRDGFSALTALSDPPRLWDRVARARFKLARSGFQASIADLIVAATASFHGRELFTLDRDFQRIGKAMPLKLFKPVLH